MFSRSAVAVGAALAGERLKPAIAAHFVCALTMSLGNEDRGAMTEG